jgi:hypothetical protein
MNVVRTTGQGKSLRFRVDIEGRADVNVNVNVQWPYE